MQCRCRWGCCWQYTPFYTILFLASLNGISEELRDAARIAAKSIVLLKNEGGLLPLPKDVPAIAVIGPNADSTRNLFGDYAYPAHLKALMEMKANSTFGTPVPDAVTVEQDFIAVTSVLDAIRARVSPQTIIRYASGCGVLDSSREGFAAAVEAARQSDVVVMVVGDKAGLTDGCTSGEARDRADLDLPGVQGELVRAVYETGRPVVLVLVNGRPVTLKWMADDIPAILECWFPGEEGSGAAADALFGDVNPGGKLPVSFPHSVGQVPLFYGHKPSGGRSHWKGRYVETPCEPLYPFGYGLSYTQFEYSNLRVEPAQAQPGDTVTICADVTNTGARPGDEVAQLYTHTTQASVTRPVKELKGFKRVTLQPGETRTVIFRLPVNALGCYDRNMRFGVEPGQVEVMVGASAADIRLRGALAITGAAQKITDKAFTCAVEVV